MLDASSPAFGVTHSEQTKDDSADSDGNPIASTGGFKFVAHQDHD
jgi:hypothetical protein